MRAPSPWTDATCSWNWYGQISYPQWHWCLSWQRAWTICSTYHTVLKASPGAAIFGEDMLFDITFMADWHKIGKHKQSMTDHSNQRKNNWCIDYDYKVWDKVLVEKEGILCSPITAKSHGQSLQFIQMEQSGFHAGPKQKDLISGE